MILVLVQVVLYFGQGVQSASSAYFTKYVLRQNDAWLGAFFAALTAGMLVAQPVWLQVSRRLGKQRTFLLALMMYTASLAVWFFSSPAVTAAVLVFKSLALGCTGGGVILMPSAMLPDVLDYDARRTGMRREALLASLVTMADQLATAMGLAFFGGFLSLMGYVGSHGPAVAQAPAAVSAIRLSFSIVPAALSAVCVVLTCGYDLTEQRLLESDRLG